MAIVQQPYWTLSLTFKDRDQNKGSMQLYIANSVLITEIITVLASVIIPRVSALSDAVCVGWTLTRSAYEDAAALAVESSDVERKGVFTFKGANGRPVTLQLPSIKNTLVVDRTDVLDTSNILVTQFIDMIIDGLALVTARPVTVTGSDITLFNAAYKKHRGSNRG